MSIRRVIPLGAVALLLFLPAAARAEVAVRFAPETASLFIYEPFTLRLEVESDAPPETPELPAVPDLAVTTVRRLPSDPARRKHAFQIGLIAERDGILTVPPFAVRADGETVLTSALRLRISAPRPATEMDFGDRGRADRVAGRSTGHRDRDLDQCGVVCPLQTTPARNPAARGRALPPVPARSSRAGGGTDRVAGEQRSRGRPGRYSARRTAIPLVPLQAGSARAVRAAYAARPARVRPVGWRTPAGRVTELFLQPFLRGGR